MTYFQKMPYGVRRRDLSLGGARSQTILSFLFSRAGAGRKDKVWTTPIEAFPGRGLPLPEQKRKGLSDYAIERL